MQSRYKAPFLHKAILIEILNTYRGKDLFEKKEEPSTLGKLFNGFKSAANFNTPEDSEKWYTLLRRHIDDATDNQNIESWIYLICHTGIAGHTTDSGSFWGSKLCCSAFALRSYILNSINKMCESIESNKPLNEEQALAIKIKDAIKNATDIEKQIITQQNQVLKLRKDSDPIYTSNLYTFDFDFKACQKSAERTIEHSQRKLCYLGDYDSLKEEKYQITTGKQKSIKELFPKLPTSSTLKLDKKTEEKMRFELPFYFQKPYDAIYIRSKEPDLVAKDDEDESVVNAFEFKAMSKIKDGKSQSKLLAPLHVSEGDSLHLSNKKKDDEDSHEELSRSDSVESNDQSEEDSLSVDDEKPTETLIEQPKSTLAPELKQKSPVKENEELLWEEKYKINTTPRPLPIAFNSSAMDDKIHSPSYKGLLVSLGLPPDDKKDKKESRIDSQSPNHSAENASHSQKKKNRKHKNKLQEAEMDEKSSEENQEVVEARSKNRSR